MAFTDALLTGLLPAPFVNVPAMALLGALGGALRRIHWSRRGGAEAVFNAALAFAIGVAATILFSTAADVLTWVLLPEARSTPGSLQALVVAGWVFHLPP